MRFAVAALCLMLAGCGTATNSSTSATSTASAVTGAASPLAACSTGISFAASGSSAGTGNNPRAVVAADLNADSHPDLIVTNLDGNAVSVLLGKGDGGFGAHVEYPVGTHPYLTVVGDFNGDGALDLATGNFGAADVSILLGKGDGTLRSTVDYPTSSTLVAITAADINGDGNADLLASGGDQVAVLIAKNGIFQVATQIQAPGAYDAVVPDLNSDHVADLVVASSGTNSVRTMVGTCA